MASRRVTIAKSMATIAALGVFVSGCAPSASDPIDAVSSVANDPYRVFADDQFTPFVGNVAPRCAKGQRKLDPDSNSPDPDTDYYPTGSFDDFMDDVSIHSLVYCNEATDQMIFELSSAIDAVPAACDGVPIRTSRKLYVESKWTQATKDAAVDFVFHTLELGPVGRQYGPDILAVSPEERYRGALRYAGLAAAHHCR